MFNNWTEHLDTEVIYGRNLMNGGMSKSMLWILYTAYFINAKQIWKTTKKILEKACEALKKKTYRRKFSVIDRRLLSKMVNRIHLYTENYFFFYSDISL